MPIDPIPLKKIRLFYEEGFGVPLILKRSDPFCPWEFYKRVYSRGMHSFFLDSLQYSPPAQRYSYVGWKSYLHAFFKDGKFWTKGEQEKTKLKADLLKELRRFFSVKLPPRFSFDCFMGGAVGYLGYELAQEFDRISFRKKRKVGIPSLALLFFRDLVVFDHKTEDYYLVSWLIPQKKVPFSEALKKAEHSIKEMESVFLEPPQESPGSFQLTHFRAEISESDFRDMVNKAKAYIRAGDIYQANLSQRFSFKFTGSPLTLYQRLREVNPSPYAAALKVGDLFVASSSPELLIEKKGNAGVTCPIAGTRPRGRVPEETRRFLKELSTNEKEKAEHLMLVDLERNDLGRVSEWRTVRVKDFMRIEKYARVMHLVSKIEGRIHPTKDGWDLIKVMFPGGTVTGCPKLRSMEIIDELEPVERGIYTGSIGYIGFDGNLKLNIAIRTLILYKNRGYLQVGAGIVADSDARREYEETLAKGEALAEALLQACTP